MDRIRKLLPKSDTLECHLSGLVAGGQFESATYRKITEQGRLNAKFRRFLDSVLVLAEPEDKRWNEEKTQKSVSPEDVDELTYPEFIRFLSSMSTKDNVLHSRVLGVFDPAGKRPMNENESTHTAVEALCNEHWRTLESLIGRISFASLVLNHVLLDALRPELYFQVSGHRIDQTVFPKPDKAPPRINPGGLVPRKDVLECKLGFYYSPGRSGFNLNLKQLADCKDEKVEFETFMKCVLPYSYRAKHKRIPKRLLPFVDIGTSIMEKCQKHNFRPQLDAWLPLEREIHEKGHEMNDVVSFLFAASHKVFPHALFGTAENWDTLRSKYVYYLQLPSQQRPHLDSMTDGFKFLDIDWLFTSDKNKKKSRDDFFKAREIFDQLMIWITNRFLPQLLKSFFYFTDSATSDQIIYRQEIWQKKTRQTLTALKTSQFSSTIITPSDLGVSKFRLVPKKSGYRPIVSLGRPVYKVGKEKTISVNKRLTQLHKILSQEFRLGGFDKCGLDSINLLKKTLGMYEKKVKAQVDSLKFVKIDVTAAFDTIPATKVKDIAWKLLNCENYSVHKHTIVAPMGPKAMLRWFTTTRACDGKSEGALQAFRRTGKKGVIVDENRSVTVGKRVLCKLMSEHLFRNDVMIDGQVHRQVRGIPQGSVLSSLFCAMVYEDMIREEFSDLIDREDTCLLRYVDDFLLISTDTQVATEFLKRALDGVPEYGVAVNREKCLVNFPVPFERVKNLEEGEMIPFLGMSIDSQNLQVHRDYPYSSRMLWVDKGVKLDQVGRKALNYFTARFPGKLFNKKVPEAVVLRNVCRYYRFVLLRAVRTFKHFNNIPESRVNEEAVNIAASMIEISMSIVKKQCPNVDEKKMRGWLTRITWKTILKKR